MKDKDIKVGGFYIMRRPEDPRDCAQGPKYVPWMPEESVVRVLSRGIYWRVEAPDRTWLVLTEWLHPLAPDLRVGDLCIYKSKSPSHNKNTGTHLYVVVGLKKNHAVVGFVRSLRSSVARSTVDRRAHLHIWAYCRGGHRVRSTIRLSNLVKVGNIYEGEYGEDILI